MLKKILFPLSAPLLVIALWYVIVHAFDVPKYLLPLPDQVVHRMVSDFGFLMQHTGVTLLETLGGFALSAAIGIPLAALIVASPAMDKAIMPWLILSQTFPKVALAPLIVVWFGLGFGPKVVITFLVAFFPVVISTVVGLRSMEKDMLELARSMRATPLQMFFRFQLPLGMPAVFSGLKVSVALAVVGAVIAEWVGANQGLGYLLLSANGSLDTELIFVVLFALTVIGIGLYYAVELVERLCIPWHASIRLHEGGR